MTWQMWEPSIGAEGEGEGEGEGKKTKGEREKEGKGEIGRKKSMLASDKQYEKILNEDICIYL